MNDVTAANFGLLIAFLLPGFVTLWGIGEFSGTIHSWFTGSPDQSPSVGGFLYVTLGAVATGLFVSTVRWLLIDRIHHRTGIVEPQWDFAALNQNLATFEILVASHYRFYQAYANMAVAVVLAFIAATITTPEFRVHLFGYMVGLTVVETVLWLGSRDTLQKYYRRAEALMEGNKEGSLVRTLPQTDRRPVSKPTPTSPGKIRLKIEGPFR